jgi:hypothetical protein
MDAMTFVSKEKKNKKTKGWWFLFKNVGFSGVH